MRLRISAGKSKKTMDLVLVAFPTRPPWSFVTSRESLVEVSEAVAV